jgi:hypothetical protein
MNFTFCSARQPPRWSRSCSSPRHNRRRVSQRRTGRPHAYVHETNHFSLHIRLVFEPRGTRSHQHRYVARSHHWNQRSGGIRKFDFHTGPRDAQCRNDIADRFGYGASPLAAYAAALAASVFIFERSDIGPPLLAGALVLLLLINIRNAWDLTLFFAQRRAGGNSPP